MTVLLTDYLCGYVANDYIYGLTGIAVYGPSYDFWSLRA